MHILVAFRALIKRRRLRFRIEFIESRHQRRPLRRSQDPHAFERPRKRLRTSNVHMHQPPIEVKRSGKALEYFRRPFFESPSPELHFFLAFLPFFTWVFLSEARTCIGSPIRLMKPLASR